MTDEVALITSNPEKVAAAAAAFEGRGIALRQFDPGLPEIQASTSVAVARHTVESVLDDGLVGVPVVREDHGLVLDAVPGFPGPYLSHFDDHLPAERLLDLLAGEPRTGQFTVGTVLGLPDGTVESFEFEVPIEVADRPSGETGNWDRVLRLADTAETFAASDPADRRDVWNRNFRRIADRLSE